MDAIAGYLKQQNADFCLLQEVDIGSTRTYHVDEREPLYAALFNKSSVFCQNYDSPYLLYPLTAPHGASRSGLLTFSPANITAADRVELPGGVRLYEASGPGPLLLRQPCPRLRRR